ncbi:MAG: flagellar hook-basal body complex protein FliE [Synergistaceae bacterium]|nr:flagellar hook-basal body complex protein FliE [Synergistaceae bacterium]
MERLLIDFSKIYGQNGTKGVTRSVYNTQTNALKEQEIMREAPRVSFEDMLSDSIKNVNNLQLEAEKKIRDMAIGDVDDISEVVLASSRADTALRLVMEMRNKFLDAYQALSRITG